MRVNGHNVLAIAVAALVIYIIEFVIYGLLITPDQYMTMSGITADQAAAGQARMPLGIISPVLAAIGLSFAVKWRGAAGWLAGLTTGVLVAVLFAFAASFYRYVYGPATETYMAVDLAHFVVCYGAAGALLSVWK